MDVAMTQHDQGDNREPRREPIRVTPAAGRVSPPPDAAAVAAAADASTARLVAVMHELNNLLDGATRTLSLARRSLGDMALAPGLDPAIAHKLETANTALEQMGQLLHVAMRPGSTPALVSWKTTTSLIETITHSLDVHRPLALEHHIELVAEISPRLILAHAGPIYPTLANAIRNAIEAIIHSNLGSRIELIAELDTPADGPPMIHIDIVDDGPGPDQYAQKHAFDPGFTTKNEGFGIGLSLGRQIMRSLDGTIKLHPRSPADTLRPSGRGAHVVIQYPLAQAS